MNGRGVTVDSGVLIALDHRKAASLKLIRTLVANGRKITVPMVVLAEWWRGTTEQALWRRAFEIEEMKRPIAEAAGVALGAVAGATTIDAIVMASAALRGDIVYTSDVEDLTRLRSFFPNVRVFAA